MDLIQGLAKRYPSLDTKYISNVQIDTFLKESEGKFDWDDLKNLQQFIWVECKLSRRILKDWDSKFNQNIPQPLKNLPSETVHLGIRNRIDEQKYQDFFQKKEWVAHLTLRRYSPRTIKNYTQALASLNRWLIANKKKEIQSADLEGIKEYFQDLTVTKLESTSSIRIKRFSYELYSSEILKKDISLDFVKGLRKEEFLPTIFSKEEVRKILNSTHNLKHKMILSLYYIPLDFDWTRLSI